MFKNKYVSKNSYLHRFNINCFLQRKGKEQVREPTCHIDGIWLGEYKTQYQYSGKILYQQSNIRIEIDDKRKLITVQYEGQKALKKRYQRKGDTIYSEIVPKGLVVHFETCGELSFGMVIPDTTADLELIYMSRFHRSGSVVK